MRILIDRSSCRGDILAATCILPGLRERYPDAKIDWLALPGDWSVGLLNNPHLDQIVHYVNPADYDLVYHPDHQTDWYAPMEQIYCDQLGLPFHGPEIYFSDEEWKTASTMPRDFIAIVVLAGWGTRMWPHKNWEELVTRLRSHGETVFHIATYHEPGLSNANYVWRCDLREATILLSRAKMYLGIDTYALHVAAAMNKPTIAVMCPTGPENIWLGEKGISVRPDYAPCTWSRRIPTDCPYRGCPTCGGTEEPGIARIPVDTVFNATRLVNKY